MVEHEVAVVDVVGQPGLLFSDLITSDFLPSAIGNKD